MAVVCLLMFGCAANGASTEAVAGARPILSPLNVLTSARLYPAPGLAFSIPPQMTSPVSAAPAPVAPAYLSFLAPTVVAARNNSIYIADSGRRQLFRYDVAYMALSPFSSHPAGSVTAAAVAPDMSLFVADVEEGRVLHFSWDGRLLQTFSSQSAMARPVGILLNEATSQVLVADNLYNHVVIFNSLGHPMGSLKSDHAHSLDAMAGGPDGLYLVDRAGREVVVMGLDGEDRYSLGGGVLKDPQAIAVDRFNRVYVGDAFDNTIKVFEGDDLVASFGGSAGGASFNRITSLYIDHDTLYVADSLNRRIQIFRIETPVPRALSNE